MMDFVDALIKWTPVQGTVAPIMPCILDDKEYQYLHDHFLERRKGDTGIHAEVFCHGVEEPDLR